MADDESWNKSPTDDTAKARAYASSPLGIRPIEYGAYLDGRLSLRKEMKDQLAQQAERVSSTEKCLFQMQEAAKDLTQENVRLREALEHICNPKCPRCCHDAFQADQLENHYHEVAAEALQSRQAANEPVSEQANTPVPGQDSAAPESTGTLNGATGALPQSSSTVQESCPDCATSSAKGSAHYCYPKESASKIRPASCPNCGRYAKYQTDKCDKGICNEERYL